MNIIVKSDSKNQINYSINKKFILYLMSGGIAFAVELGVFNLVYIVIGANIIISNSISFLAGLITSYSMNNYVVFKDRRFTMSSTHRKILYFILACINLILTNILIWFFVEVKIDSLIAKILVMGLVVIWNFAIFNRLIFRQRH